MHEPNNDNTPPEEQLQFDKAEFTGEEKPAASVCTSCKQTLTSVYYELNANALCLRCKEQMESAMQGGLGAARFVRAAVYGAAASVLGALIFFGVAALTGYVLALISVLIGWLVGYGVLRGSRARGGLLYQLLAVVLTLNSIACSYGLLAIYEVWKEDEETEMSAGMQAVPAERTSGPLESVLADSDRVTTAGAKIEEHENDTLTSASAQTIAVNSLPPEKEHRLPAAAALGISVAFFLFLGFSALYYSATGSPLTLLIVGFGLWEAWKLNRRREHKLRGPFSPGETQTSDPQS